MQRTLKAKVEKTSAIVMSDRLCANGELRRRVGFRPGAGVANQA
jgi:hypothetical protein